MCEKSNNKSSGNGESFGELSKQKQALQRERDALIEESTKLRSDMTNAEDRINNLEKESAEGKYTIHIKIPYSYRNILKDILKFKLIKLMLT